VPDLIAVEPTARERAASQVFSWTGVLPLGAFLVVHLAANTAALRGGPRPVFSGAAGERAPLFAWAEGVLVFAPLLVHAALGLALVVSGRPRLGPSPYPPGLRAAMRATAAVVAAFIALHVVELAGPIFGGRLSRDEVLTLLSARLSATSHGVPWRGALYLAAIGCVAFHFAAGVWAWFARSRAGNGARARVLAAWTAVAFGAALWLGFANIVISQATGAAPVGQAGEEAGETGNLSAPRCPPAMSSEPPKALEAPPPR
jgi:succinate dehydrogenase / fumarate reductase cytochrome b subunit